MAEPTIRIDREVLYQRVWSTPMSRLAPEYGLSDVGLAKLCKRLNVPRPQRGHWMRTRFGKAADPPALPPSSVSEVVITQRERPRRRSPRARRPAAAALPPSAAPHPLVERTRRALSKRQPNHTGIIELRGTGLLSLQVSATMQDRGLQLMDALLRLLEAHGHELTVNEANQASAVRIDGETVSFSLREKLVRPEATPEDSWSPRYVYAASGKLVIRIHGLEWTGLRQRWCDGTKQRLEQCVEDVVAGLELAAQHRKAARIEREEYWRRKDEERAREAARQRQREYEQELITQLRNQAATWHEASRIRGFLDALDREMGKVEDHKSPVYVDWLIWARRVADHLDPCCDPGSIPKPLRISHDEGSPRDRDGF